MANFGSFSGLIYLQKSVYQYVMTKKGSLNKEIGPTQRPLDLCTMWKFYVACVFNFTNHL